MARRWHARVTPGRVRGFAETSRLGVECEGAVKPKDDPPIALAPASSGNARVKPPEPEAQAPEPPAVSRQSVDFFVRAVTIASVVATVLGVLVLPGLLGNVGERFVVWGEHGTAVASYVAFVGVLLLTSSGAYDLIQRVDLGVSRFVLLGLSVVVVGLVAPAVSTRLMAIPQVLLALAAGAFAIVAALRALRAPHTRAPGGILGLLGLAALLRALSWAIAAVTLNSPLGFSFARILATAAVVVVGLAQLVAVAYFSTRGKVQGRLLGNLALVLGFVATFVAARKPEFAGPLGPILAGAIAHAQPSPDPFGLGAVARYLFPTGVFLALVAIVQRRQVTAITCGVTLALASQGRLDVPLPALFVVVSGLLLARSSHDDRAMWTDLITTRTQKQKDEDAKRNVVRPRPMAAPTPEVSRAPEAPAVATSTPPGAEPGEASEKRGSPESDEGNEKT